MNFNKARHVYDLFVDQVKQTPEAIAIECGKEQMTYSELDQKSSKVAWQLTDYGFNPGDIAALDFYSPLEMIPGILGILKAGGGYLPINHRAAREYIQHILLHSQVDYYLKSSRCENGVKFKGKTLIYNHWNHGNGDEWNREINNQQEYPLTVIYESSTSGKPEGISLSHEKMFKWLQFNLEKLRIDFSRTLFISNLRMQQGFPLWFGNLAAGGSVYFYDNKEKDHIPELLKLMAEKDFTSVICPLSFLEILALPDCSDFFSGNIRNIVSSGENTFHFNITEFKQFLKNRETPIRWHNYYGFPEINMITTLTEDELTNKKDVFHIGKPASETRAYVLNDTMQVVSIGKIGEMYLAGSGIMDRYHHNKKLNHTHFVKSDDLPDPIIYKTGYRAFWLPDGKLSLLGRTDNLVDINGNRVAPEEVEASLFKHPLVKDCAVTAKKLEGDQLRFTAYLVLREEVAYESLEEFLKNVLPPEYFPIGFVRLLSIPRTPDGLVDRPYLEQLERFDSIQVQSLEEKIREFPQIKETAVLVKEKTGHPVPLHLKDYVSNLPAVSFKKVKESPTAEVRPDSEPGRQELAIIHGNELVWEEDAPRTLAEALKRAAHQHGDNGIRFIQADGSTHFQGYSSLLEEAEQVLAGLRKLGLKPQDKVLFQFNRNEDFVSAFWGCMLAGIVPVPMMVPKSLAKTTNESETLKRVWELLEKPVILTNQHLEPSIRSLFKDFQTAKIEDLRDNKADSTWHESSPEDTAMILFTSGSTGIPKGVVQCHRSILSRERSTTMHNGGNHNDVSINWMPLEHVGGVVMFHLNDVYMGCQQIQVSTDYILTDPLRWLDIIHQYKGTITWAPNFAYALVSERVEKKPDANWDLSSMRFILNGGEAVNAVSSRKFLTLLAPYGLDADAMKPAWGMSETCSGVTYSHLFTTRSEQGIHYLDKQVLGSGLVKKNASASEPNTGTFVELGKTIPGTSIRIVDPANQVVKEGVVGRLQIQGPTVTSGYYKNPELNKEVFTPDGWFDTGDLAFILEGRMTICGRAKDVIIVNGINLNSMEIEAAVEEVEGVETSFTAACAVREENSDTDRVVIFYHSQYTDFNQVLNQVKQIQKKFGEKFGLNLDYVVPVAKEDIPKTSIGKIQRLKLAQSFQKGAFDDIVKQLDIRLENENTLPSWFFKKSWRVHPLKLYDEPGENLPRTCLVFEDGSGLSDALVNRLEKENCRCIKVKSIGEFQPLNDTCYQIDHREAGHYRRLIKEIEKSNHHIDDIFFLYVSRESQGEGIDTDVDINRIKDSHDRGLYSLLHLLQALERRSHRVKRLFVVTSNTQFTSPGDRVVYEKCSISGFLKSVSLELDWLRCSHVDLDMDPDQDLTPGNQNTHAEYLVKEWKNPGETQEVAYRKGQRLLPFLDRLDMKKEKKQSLPIKRGGIYLVTGGLGGIGTYVCKWLLQNSAAKLVIVGRTPLPEKKEWSSLLNENQHSTVSKRIRSYLDLEAAVGRGEFIYAAGDAADLAFLNQVVEQAESQWQDTTAGVFHIAGDLTGSGNLEDHWQVMDKHWAVKENRQTFEEMFQAKVYGTLALHQLLKDRRDAIFIGFSSTTAFFGSPTFSAYSAANGFLDGFCLYRKFNGWPHTYCLNWSSWDNVGMSENNPGPMIDAMLSRGYEMILPRQGIPSLQIGLYLNLHQLLIGLNAGNRHIRSYMAEYPAVNQVVNVYYTTGNKTEINEASLRQAILSMNSSLVKNSRTALKIHHIEDIPLIDGKFIDYKRLQDMDNHLQDVAVEGELPQTETEQKLAEIWREILGKKHIGINDSFFELGGHSLNATILVAKIHKAFNVKIPLADIFRVPTIKEIAQYLGKSSENKFASVEPVEKKDYYVLSAAQKRLYILQKMNLESTAYNIPEIIPLKDKPDVEKLEDTFKKLIERHESLRTSFIIVENKPVQKIHDNVEFEIEQYDLQVTGEGDRCRCEKESFIRPFDLSAAPLLRVGLIHTPSGEPPASTAPAARQREGSGSRYILVVDMHHIISDGVSHNILIKDFSAIFANGRLPQLRNQYKDFSLWQNNQLEKGIIKQQEDYWLNQFADEIPVLNLPTDFPRPTVHSFEGSTLDFHLSVEDSRGLNDIASKTGATLFMVLLAIYNVFLSKLSGQEEITVGVAIAARRHSDLEGIIGMFVNTLAMRNYPASSKLFINFLDELKKRTLDAFENQEYQFEDLVEKLGVDRDVSRNPLFDAAFASMNTETRTSETSMVRLPEPKDTTYENVNKTAKFDMNLAWAETGERFYCVFEYCTKLFREETIRRFIVYLKKIVKMVVESPNIKISDIEIITEEEKKQVLYDFNNTSTDYPKDKTIHQLFAEQVERTPDSVALVGNSYLAALKAQSAEEQPAPTDLRLSLTYGELNQRANQLSQLLQEKGVEADTIVGLMGERYVEMMVGILGILKAGGAYLPIDPSYPYARIGYMLTDSNAKILLAAQVRAKVEIIQTIDITKDLPSSTFTSTPQIDPGNLAYIIYTSGSTGKPRGVMVEHRSMVNACAWQSRYYDITQADNTTQYAPVVFDASVLEIFPCLIRGGSLHIIDEAIKLDIQELNRYYEQRDITFSFLPTQLCERFMELENRSLRGLLAAGDTLRTFVQQNYRLYNNYGPTENTVVATSYQVDKQSHNIPIGKPVDNNRIYILSPGDFRLQPPGIAGELCIKGAGTARGYMNRPELTAEKFTKNPFPGNTPLYRSGDLARWRPDGNIEFLGRLDFQVKIRGFRIELGEIENQLLAINGIKEAYVMDRKKKNGDKYLCAYFVSENPIKTTKIKGILRGNLPGYMVPGYFIQVESIPLTPNGKVDRRALPAPEANLEEGYIAPGNAKEKQIAKIWQEVLELERVGVEDNFFDLGGTSLDIIQVNSHLITEFKRDIPVVDFFRYPTIKALAAYLDQNPGEANVGTPGDELTDTIKRGKQDRMRRLQQNRRMQ